METYYGAKFAHLNRKVRNFLEGPLFLKAEYSLNNPHLGHLTTPGSHNAPSGKKFRSLKEKVNEKGRKGGLLTSPQGLIPLTLPSLKGQMITPPLSWLEGRSK